MSVALALAWFCKLLFGGREISVRGPYMYDVSVGVTCVCDF